MEWVAKGLEDLRRVVREKGIRSLAIPPLGSGQGRLHWPEVRALIERTLADLDEVEVVVYEPTPRYQAVAKRKGVQRLTPARALVAELVRRYWVLGVECSMLEIQKLTYFLDREISRLGLDDPLDLSFSANRYGPYSDRLRHLLDALDGSYLHCQKRIADATPLDTIWFEEPATSRVKAYLGSEGRAYLPALEGTSQLIDGFESAHSLELLATVDWLLTREGCEPTMASIRAGLGHWPDNAGERKQRLFDDRMLGIALDRLTTAI